MTIAYEEFDKVDLRSGTVLKVELFPKAPNPSYKVWVDSRIFDWSASNGLCEFSSSQHRWLYFGISVSWFSR
jgi:hypothetical protein